MRDKGGRLIALQSKLLCIVSCALCIVLVGCDGPKTIPEKELEVIITDILITEGVRNSGMKIQSDVPIDSIDFYSPVLNRYGYSIVDFRHTINTLASRKSNPLEAVMERVMATIDYQAAVAEYRYNIERRFDSLALQAYADTVYRLDSTLIGSAKKFRIQLDSIKAGDYHLTMDYKAMLDYRVPQKSVKYHFGKKGKKPKEDQTLWFNRSDELKTFDEVLSTPIDCDSLIVYFSSIVANRSIGKKEAPIKDTSIVENITIVYTPSLGEARRRYYARIFGEDFILYSDIYKRYEQQLQKDSLPGPVGRER